MFGAVLLGNPRALGLTVKYFHLPFNNSPEGRIIKGTPKKFKITQSFVFAV